MSNANHDPFARLFAETRHVLQRYVRKLVRSRDTADEIVQEAFARTYEQGAGVRAPKAFLFTTARNLASNMHRHERVAATDLVDSFDDARIIGHAKPIDEGLIAAEAANLLKEAVANLPPQCRAAFTLKVFHACSYKEIAERMGITPKTVEKHIARGLRDTHRYMRERYKEG